jgi:cyanate lyase
MKPGFPPTDPLLYQFYELILVNGPAFKVLIEEEFGYGIMSAIDFDMDITRKSDPKGDRSAASKRSACSAKSSTLAAASGISSAR